MGSMCGLRLWRRQGENRMDKRQHDHNRAPDVGERAAAVCTCSLFDSGA